MDVARNSAVTSSSGRGELMVEARSSVAITSKASSGCNLTGGKSFAAGFGLKAFLSVLDYQIPTEQWSQEFEWLALMFFNRDTGSEESPQLRSGIEIDVNWRFTVFNVQSPFLAIFEKTP